VHSLAELCSTKIGDKKGLVVNISDLQFAVTQETGYWQYFKMNSV
jgi:hypothetical protein